MTFREIAKKNLMFNIRKFASYFLVNSFVVCTLFLYGSLLFNETINNDPVMQGMRMIVIIGSVLITVFAIIFLIYTGFYFVRSRGKEFGVYLTLGMTHKDLSRMAVAESVMIFAGATVFGIGIGLLFSNLFYLVIGRILDISGNMFQLNLRMFLFCLGALGLAFLVQLSMIAVFIRRLSIVNITKATKTKDAARQNPIVGIVSFVFLVFSITVMADSIFHFNWLPDMPWFWDVFARFSPWLGMAIAAGMFVSLFFVIGSGINVVRAICKLFPKLYQRHVLLFSGLAHKFRAYRTILFSITLLTGFAVFFMGFALTIYIATADEVATMQPFHFTIEQRAGMNQISESELRQLIENTGAEIESLHTLPYMDSRRFVLHTEGWWADGRHWENIRTNFLVSDMYFSQFAGLDEPLVLAEYEMVLVYSSVWPPEVEIDMELVVEPLSSDTGSTVTSATEWSWGTLAGWPSREDVLWATDNPPVLEFDSQNISALGMSFANNPIRPYSAGAFVQNYAHVISHSVWLQLAEGGEVNRLVAFNLAYGNHTTVFDVLIAELSARNNLPEGIWGTHFPEMYSRLRPLSYYASLTVALQSNGFMLFVFGFLGIIGLVSVFMVLYHKFVADVDDETDTIGVYRKIGLTVLECRKYIKAHLGIVFFFPLLFGGVAALLLILALFNTQPIIDTWQYFRYVLVLYGGILIFNIGLYVALCKKFFRTVLV